jgi:hypothetical protein
MTVNFSVNHISDFLGRILGYGNHIIREATEISSSSLMNMEAFYQYISRAEKGLEK